MYYYQKPVQQVSKVYRMKAQIKVLFLAGSLSLLLSCQLNHSAPLVNQPSASTSASSATDSSALSAYLFNPEQLFKVKSDFGTQSLSAEHEAILKQALEDFVSDMSQGKTEEYFQEPDFSVKLLAGSEGSYFQSADALASLTNEAASYAIALVIYGDQTYDLYKGQLANQNFYFSGTDSLPEDNTTYLVTLDQNLQPQVFSGNLTPFSVQSESASPTPTPSPDTSSTPQPSPSELDLLDSPPPPARYQEALADAQRQGPQFRHMVGQFRPLPPPPPPKRQGKFPPPPAGAPGTPPLANGGMLPDQYPPEIRERIERERPQLARELEALRGLPPAEHYQKLKALYDKNSDLMPPLPPAPSEQQNPPPQTEPPPQAAAQQGQPPRQSPPEGQAS